MAIPENYIDKITKDGQSRMISPAADMVRVNSEEYEGDNLGDVLDEIADEIADAASSADLSGLFAAAAYNSTTKEINFLDKNNTVVATIDAKPFVRDGMVSSVSLSNGVLTITFNTDAGKEPISVSLGDLFNADNYYTKAAADGKFVVQVNGKGLSDENYTSAEKTAVATIANKADKTTVPNAYQPRLNAGTGIAINSNNQISVETGSVQAGETKPVSGNDVHTALATLLSNITIGVNGNWFVGDTSNPANDTGVKAQGPTGNVQFEDLDDLVALLVNDLTTGGAGNFLSAEMGKVLRKNVAIIAAKVDSIINALAGIAFVGSPVAPIGQLDWEGAAQTVYSVTTNFTGCDATETLPQTVNELATLSFTLEAETGYSLPYGVKVTVGGSPVAASYNRATGAVSIEAILGDVVIEAVALDEDNIAFEGVGIYPNGSTDAYLMAGTPETRYISPVFDLGASRSSAVAVKYKGGGVAMFDSNGIYNGALSSQSSLTTGAIPTTSRYIRLFGMTADIADGVLKVSDVVMFDGSKVGSDIGGADDFLADGWRNSNGDLVGWVYRRPGSPGNTPYLSAENSLDIRGFADACPCTKIGGGVAGAQGNYVIGKAVDMPVLSGKANTIKFSIHGTVPEYSNSASNDNKTLSLGSYLSLLYTPTGSQTGRTYFTLEEGTSWTTDGGIGSPHYVRVKTNVNETRTRCLMNCTRSTYEDPTKHVFIADGNNKVLWINPAYTGDIHDVIGQETN